MEVIIYLVVGAVVGLAIGWLLKAQSGSNLIQNINNELNELKSKNAVLESESSSKDDKIDELTQKTETDSEKIIALNSKIAGMESDIKNWQEKLAEHQELFEKNEKMLKEKFENLANKILEEKTQKFTETNRTNLDIILNPLKEKITNFEKKVEEAYNNESKERFSLKEEVKNLVEMNTKLNTEAENLTRALKGDRKKQGNWGELMLENILANSGLREGKEFEKQYSTTDDESNRIMPDFVVKLPDNKHIIIDSKVSLVAYERFANTDDADEQRSAISEHIISVKNHIKDLSGKDYSTGAGINSPDFVLLFMPIESSFAAAIDADADLFTYAWDRKIVIVSPTTLLATLKTVASLWRLEKQNVNAAKIATEAGSLYNKFNGFVEDLKKMGEQLTRVRNTYDATFNKLSEGSGNLISKVEKLKVLGAKTSKLLDQNLLDEALENDEDE